MLQSLVTHYSNLSYLLRFNKNQNVSTVFIRKIQHIRVFSYFAYDLHIELGIRYETNRKTIL